MRRGLRDTWAVVATALLTGALLVSALGYLRRTGLDAAEALARSLSGVIAEQTARTLQSVDARLQILALQLDGLRRDGRVQPATVGPLLRTELQELPYVRALWVVDARGRVAFETGEHSMGRDVSDTAYVQAFRRDPSLDLFVGGVQRSRTTGLWMIPVARPLRDADGSVRALMVAAVDPPYFEQLWRRVDLGDTGTVSLFQRSGALVVRSPADETVLGRDFSNTPLFRHELPKAAAGLFVKDSAIDGVRRIVAYRTLPTYPQLLVTVGLGYDEALAAWRRFASLTALVWGLAVVLAFVLTLQLRRQARSRARTEQRFGLLAQAVPQIVFTTDAAGAVRFISRRWTEVTGRPPGQALGNGWQEAIHPDDCGPMRAYMQVALATGGELSFEHRLRTRDGSYRWQLLRAVPVHEEGQQAPDWYGTATDIDDLKRAQEQVRDLNAGLEERIAERTGQLARQEALFRTLAEEAPLPFWTMDPQGRVTFLSRAWYELAGGAPPDWHGREWTRLIHPDDVEAVQQNWARSMATGQPYAGTRRIRARDGMYHAMTYRAHPVRDEHGAILFWVGVDTDITELTANAAALRLANEQLEAFSYSVSHDLQSPLQRVGSYARLLQEELGPAAADKARHYLARIQANAQAMSQLIEGLLALAHVSEVQVIRAAVNLSELAAEILQRLQAEEPQRRVHWRVEPGLTVLGDVRLLRSVLENLVGNAWKFTAREANAEIVVGGSHERGEYFVRDNGCGFDMAYADRLFGTFQRLHGADEFPGTGIGLATVARAISRQGGRVWAQSAPGQGATFWFTLPPA